MKNLLCVVLLMLGCKEKPEITNDVTIPASAYTKTYRPIQPTFGYNPEHARILYDNTELEFVNLDPAQYPDALGHIVTSTTLSLPFPAQLSYLWKVAQGSLANRAQTYGFVPSPFDYQNNATIDGINMRYTLSDSLGNAELNGRIYMNLNCFSCHAGVVGNQVVGGLPNNKINYYNTILGNMTKVDAELFNKIPRWALSTLVRIVSLVTQADVTTRGLSERDMEIFSATLKTLEVVFDVVGGYEPMPTQNLQFYFVMVSTYLKDNGISYEDWDYTDNKYKRELAGRIAQYKQLPVAAPKAWWLHRYMTYRGVVNYTPATLTQTSIDFTIFFRFPGFHNPLEQDWEESYLKMTDIIAYMDKIESPIYPKEIKQNRISEGRALYDKHCSTCHGALVMTSPMEYRLDYVAHDAEISIEDLGTDVNYIKAFKDVSNVVEPIITPYKKHAHFPTTITAVSGDTYHAPPLVGVWATAPYLHNQSVPTLYHVLNSRARPTRWRIAKDRYAYDYENVGMVFEEVVEKNLEDRYIYDTTVAEAGTSNMGHTYGDILSDKERYSLIEFLKTLNTNNVTPHPIGD